MTLFFVVVVVVKKKRAKGVKSNGTYVGTRVKVHAKRWGRGKKKKKRKKTGNNQYRTKHQKFLN